jgi:hypothetical protein
LKSESICASKCVVIKEKREKDVSAVTTHNVASLILKAKDPRTAFRHMP